MSLRLSSLFVIPALVLSAQCSSTPSVDGDAATDAIADNGVDVTITPPCESNYVFETGDPTGHAAPLTASATQARAGRLAVADLPTDPTGLATYAAGDFVLANDRVAVIIEPEGPSDLYNPWGGGLVGISRVEGGRLVEPADFNELIYGVGLFTIDAESVTVLRDGADGGPAVVRAVGPLKEIPFLGDFGRLVSPRRYDDLRAAMDYELAPGADHVDVYMTFDVRRNRTVQVYPAVHGFFQDGRMPMYAPVTGFGRHGTSIPFAGFVLDEATSYAWMPMDSEFTSLLSELGFNGYTSQAFSMPACTQVRRHTARLVMGRGLDGLLANVARVRGEAQREIHGTVIEADGTPAARVHVHAISPDGSTYFTRVLSGADGSFSLRVPATATVRTVAWRDAEGRIDSADLAPGAASPTLRMPASAYVHIVATESGSDAPLPVRVQLIPVGTPAIVAPESFGEQTPNAGRSRIEFATRGDLTVPVAPGTYRVVVSHGYEYELDDTTVSPTAGATTTVTASLRRSVATPGVMCADFHIHTSRSADSDDDARTKLTALVSDGLEIAVRSDHEYVSDFQPLIRDLGLESWAHGVPSLELTTLAYGHFGVVPLPPDPSRINAGAPYWPGRTPAEVFAEVRARPSAPTIIINHPRGAAPGAYFSASEYDPDSGTATTRPGFWDTAFTAVEFFNDSSFESNRDGTVRDWFSFLNHGRRVFATGSSDSHHTSFAPAGYPRTCLYLGIDDPRMASDNAIRDAAAQGRSFVSGGIYVTADVAGIGPGQDARGVGATAAVNVTVQAASWITAQRLEVIVDGVTVQTVPLDATTADPANPVTRFRRQIPVAVAERGSWVIFAAGSDVDLEPVHPRRRAFGVTNPIFLSR